MQRSQAKIFEVLKQVIHPNYVCTLNMLETVVICLDDSQFMKFRLESAQKEQLGKCMVASLMEIANLESTRIPLMMADDNGIFRISKENKNEI